MDATTERFPRTFLFQAEGREKGKSWLYLLDEQPDALHRS